MYEPTVGILIPSLPKDSLTELLRSLQGQRYDELIIDIEPGNVGFKRYRLYNKSKSDILIYIDDDIIVPKNFVSGAVTAFRNSGAEYGQIKVVGGIENSYDKFVGACTIFKRETLEDINWSSTIPFYNEDIDLHWTLQEKEFKYTFIDNVTVYHPSLGNYEKLVLGNEILKQKHPERYKELENELR